MMSNRGCRLLVPCLLLYIMSCFALFCCARGHWWIPCCMAPRHLIPAVDSSWLLFKTGNLVTMHFSKYPLLLSCTHMFVSALTVPMFVCTCVCLIPLCYSFRRHHTTLDNGLRVLPRNSRIVLYLYCNDTYEAHQVDFLALLFRQP